MDEVLVQLLHLVTWTTCWFQLHREACQGACECSLNGWREGIFCSCSVGDTNTKCRRNNDLRSGLFSRASSSKNLEGHYRERGGVSGVSSGFGSFWKISPKWFLCSFPKKYFFAVPKGIIFLFAMFCGLEGFDVAYGEGMPAHDFLFLVRLYSVFRKTNEDKRTLNSSEYVHVGVPLNTRERHQARTTHWAWKACSVEGAQHDVSAT